MNEEGVLCKCGYDSTLPDRSPWITESTEYSLWGWLIIAIGVSSLPSAIVLKCHKCGFVFERSFDLEKREERRFS